METFFILLVVVFVPFIWFILRALRYTNETIGENSPLYKERTYQLSASDYFIKFTKILTIFVAIMMVAMAIITYTAALQQHLLLLIFPCLFLICAGMFGFVIYFDWQYWTITRNVAITLNPFDPSITVDEPERQIVLRPTTILRIEHHLKQTSNSKDLLGGYGYFLFYTTDGQIARVNNIFFVHVEFLERFFATVPQTIVWHKLPWITGSSRAEIV